MKGSCLCGAVVFEIAGDLTPIELCHCTRCRKAYGSAFAATFYVRASAFRWLQGEDRVTVYDAAIRERPPAYRHAFCGGCGSALPIVNREVDYAEIPAGLMDDDPGVRPIRQIFTQRKAPWYEPSAELPQHREHVPPAEHLIVQLLSAPKRR
jgi:hypothetical protein